MQRFEIRCAVALLFCAAGSGAHADGAIEINQVCVDSGCFSGDAPGFPVEITQPGHYRLTSDLYRPEVAEPHRAISIAADDVTLDLNGFSISSDTTCSGTPPVCTDLGLGAGSGIEFVEDSTNAHIANGSIRGFANIGIFSDSGVTVSNFLIERVRISQMGEIGIAVRGSGKIDSVSVSQCLFNGMFVGFSSFITTANSIFERNGRWGVRGGICRDNTFAENNMGAGEVQHLCDSLVGDNFCSNGPC